MVNDQHDLSKNASAFFNNIFKDPGTTRIGDQLRVIQHYPRLFSIDDNQIIGRSFTLGEIESILKICVKEKILGPDGWTVEFYLGFWDILGEELPLMVEDTRRHGYISGAVNSTFIALIPKNSKPLSFEEYRPISLCNFIYKIISKIIVE